MAIDPKRYMICIHVPAYVDASGVALSTVWARSLFLLRDSLAERFSHIVCVAPSLPMASIGSEHHTRIDAEQDGLVVVPSFDLRCRARHYWLKHRKQWRLDVRRELEKTAIAHTGLSDLFRPINLDAFREVRAANRVNIFVRDTDEILKRQQLSVNEGFLKKAFSGVYNYLYRTAMIDCVRSADLSMLKGRSLMERYAQIARNAKLIQNTSYSAEHIVSEEIVAARTRSLQESRRLRLVYFGRFEKRKGLEQSIEIIARLKALGVVVEFDVFGTGAEQEQLRSLASNLGVEDRIKFRGYLAYGPELFQVISDYDGLLFTPLAEDTPRMIFDAYACGLPVVAYDIEYVRERADIDGGVEALPFLDIDGAAHRIAALDRDRGRLVTLAMEALAAARENTAEAWYRRRAEWTFEAYDRGISRLRMAG